MKRLFQCGSMGSLRVHLSNAHGFEFEDIHDVFPSAQEFEEWKSNLENGRFFNLVAERAEKSMKKESASEA